jgi:hypothetical protein
LHRKALDYRKRGCILHGDLVPQTRKRNSAHSCHAPSSSSIAHHFSNWPAPPIPRRRHPFWEPARLLYNLALTAAAIFWLAATWPHFRPALTFTSLLPVSVLGFLANVCYCAAYLVDIPMQRSAQSAVWKRRRWILWLAGTLFALLLANYWIADEIYPDFH